MNRKALLSIGSVAAFALCSTFVLAQDAPESLLPPGFDDPAPAPTPAPAPAPTSQPGARPAAPSPGSTPVVQPLPSGGGGAVGGTAVPRPSGAPIVLPPNLPSLAELEELTADEIDEALGLKPRYDIPPAARRSMERVGVLASWEGGLPAGSLANQPASIVRAALTGTQRQLVSRWGHIMLRRALVSRLAAPEGMNPAEFAALRAAALNRLGEHEAARALVQDVDTGNWNEALTNAALEAYIGTADIVGACPALRLSRSDRDDAQWRMWQSICAAYAGEGTRARSDLSRALRNEIAPEIDVLLAQRYAGAAGLGRRTVNLEWDGVEELTPWRFALANALGAELPESLLSGAGRYYQRIASRAPMLPIERRIAGAEEAARTGILSSRAYVDLYGQAYAASNTQTGAGVTASRLRESYVASTPEARLDAIRDVWGDGDSIDYAGQVLTAYAAARMPADGAFADDAGPLIASMLSAGLDRDALSWGSVVPQGSEGWALLVLAQPSRNSAVDSGALDAFIGDDGSEEQRKSQFLVAGLAALGRIDDATREEMDLDLGMDLGRQSKWSQLISRSAELDNPGLVALLAGLGMQGSGWDKMTARHLYHVVRALDQVGLSAEARMIAAEAVARG